MGHVAFAAQDHRILGWFLPTLLLATAPILVPETARAAGETVAFSGGFPTTSKKNVYPLSQVKRGDKGIGYTVFSADKIAPFNVEVLGILENMLGPHKHVILTRLSGPEIEFTGVIAGMSGSPVYIDGKLVGAVAYRFGAFSKEAIAGVTPIESMIGAYREPPEPPRGMEPASTAARSVDLAPVARLERALSPKGISVADFRSRAGLAAAQLPKARALQGPYEARAIETPVSIAGFEPGVASDLKTRLGEAGFVAMIGSAGGRVALRENGVRKIELNRASIAGGVNAAPIAPGAPLAAVLMRGDMNVAATGTVTLVDDGEVLAFGHPFLGYGSVTIPMATASILNTLASPLGSYKQGAPSLEVGTITNDRLTAIAGRIGGVSPMVPVRVHISATDPSLRNLGSETQVEIVKDPIWLPMLLEAAIASSAQAQLSYEAGGTVDMDVRIDVGDRSLRLVDTYSADAPLQVSAFVARDVSAIVGLITRTSLVKADVRAVEATLKVKPVVALATIEKVIPDRSVVHPGDKVGLTVELRPFRRPLTTVHLVAEIPSDARGEVELYVGGGIEMDRREGELYGERIPIDLDQLLGILAERRPARGIYAAAFMQRPGLRSGAELLSSLPPSERALLAIAPGRTVHAVTEALGPVTGLPYPDVVVGGHGVQVSVVR